MTLYVSPYLQQPSALKTPFESVAIDDFLTKERLTKSALINMFKNEEFDSAFQAIDKALEDNNSAVLDALPDIIGEVFDHFIAMGEDLKRLFGKSDFEYLFDLYATYKKDDQLDMVLNQS